MSLSNNIEILTAIANDLAYEEIFVVSTAGPIGARRHLAGCLVIGTFAQYRASAHLGPRSTVSARSPSPALTVVTSGRPPKSAIHVDGTNYGVIEDLHQTVMHALAQYIRQSRMTAGCDLLECVLIMAAAEAHM